MITLRNKFDELQEISETPTLNDKYETLAVRKKRVDVKTAFLRNRRNPTNINSQKLMKVQN